MRSVLDTADFELKGVPAVVFVEPSWYEQAKLIGSTANLPERRIQALPTGKFSSNSEEGLALIKQHIADVIAGLVKALQ